MVTDDTSEVIVVTILDKDRRMTVKEIAYCTQISRATMHCILTSFLEKGRVSAHWVPHLLIAEQKQPCLITATELLTHFHRGEMFLKCTVAIDEMRTRDFEPELKSQSPEWRHRLSLCPSKCRKVQSHVNQMLIMMYD